MDVVLDSRVDVSLIFPRWCRSSPCAAPLAHEAPCKAARIQSRALQSMNDPKHVLLGDLGQLFSSQGDA